MPELALGTRCCYWKKMTIIWTRCPSPLFKKRWSWTKCPPLEQDDRPCSCNKMSAIGKPYPPLETISFIETRWPPFKQYVGDWKKMCAIENNIHYGNKMAALITRCLPSEQDVYRWIKMPRPSNTTVAIGNSVHY
jgi:hypothetical protein